MSACEGITLHIGNQERWKSCSPDEQLNKAGGTLVNSQLQRLEIKLEEDSWHASVMLQDARVVRHTVLVGIQWLRARGNVRSRDHM